MSGSLQNLMCSLARSKVWVCASPLFDCMNSAHDHLYQIQLIKLCFLLVVLLLKSNLHK